jgi:hypothetical protein
MINSKKTAYKKSLPAFHYTVMEDDGQPGKTR